MAIEVICEYLQQMCGISKDIASKLNAMQSTLYFQDLTLLQVTFTAVALGIVSTFLLRSSTFSPVTFIVFPAFCLVCLSPAQLSFILIVKFMGSSIIMLVGNKEQQDRVPPLLILAVILMLMLIVENVHRGQTVPTLLIEMCMSVFAMFFFKAMIQLPSLLPITGIVTFVLIAWNYGPVYTFVTKILGNLTSFPH